MGPMNRTPTMRTCPDMSSETNGTPVVEFRSVTKTFNPGTARAYTALKDVSFAIEDLPHYGEFIAILGPSGCGKSTLLNLIAGFPEVYPPTSGEVLVRGKQVSGPGRDRGMIFQRYSSFPHKTVLENVLFGLELNAHEPTLKPAKCVDLAHEWIEKVGLAEHAFKYPHQLSGGQQQRVAIARTLVLKPGIILMDEPFSALDEPTRLEMQRLILELWEQVEATVFLVTHSVSEAVYLGDRVWIFTRAPGQIARELKAEIPRTRGQSPFEAQNSALFKKAVDEVTRAFQEVMHQANLT